VKISVIHGPNLRQLGRREPDVYGLATLDDVNDGVLALARELNVEVDTFQSNAEGAILDHLEALAGVTDGILINPGGLSHTSVALRDGLVAAGVPCVEVHLSNVHARERFRRHSFIAPIAVGVVAGFGLESYLSGLRGLVTHLKNNATA
jgi:3-dehydroquinate dehydratase-2